MRIADLVAGKQTPFATYPDPATLARLTQERGRRLAAEARRAVAEKKAAAEAAPRQAQIEVDNQRLFNFNRPRVLWLQIVRLTFYQTYFQRAVGGSKFNCGRSK